MTSQEILDDVGGHESGRIDASAHTENPLSSSTNPFSNLGAFLSNTGLEHPTDPHQDAASSLQYPSLGHVRKPSEAGLHIHTGIDGRHENVRTDSVAFPSSESEYGLAPLQSISSGQLPSRGSFEAMASALSSPPSSISSPMLGALADVTPLPSPLVGSMDLGIWRNSSVRSNRSRGSSSASMAREEAAGLLGPAIRAMSPNKMKKQYPSLGAPSAVSQQQSITSHSRNRSTSEYVPDALQNIRPRHVTTPGSVSAHAELNAPDTVDQQLHREEYLADRKKNVTTVAATTTADTSGPSETSSAIPTPPPSDQGATDGEGTTADVRKSLEAQFGQLTLQTRQNGNVRTWAPLRLLGRGAFSQVILASSDTGDSKDLVAIKIVSHDLSVGSDEERMGTSIKREIEMLQSVSHPCLPQLYSFDDSPQRALLVLNYCPGGDLFELASQHKEQLTASIVQRVFAELVDAVAYLHRNYIVHRDIKLENVLFNVPAESLASIAQPQRLTYPLTTLTDLGLSRRIPQPPQSPLLTHACGSADYAAPELLLGQAYDGRATDAWSLGVLLYAILEGRLPFDPLPGKRNTSNVKHRIARCDWLWCEYGDRWGDWVEDTPKGKEMDGARRCVEGLLKKVGRGRWTLDQVKEQPWVQDGLATEGGLRIERNAKGSLTQGG